MRENTKRSEEDTMYKILKADKLAANIYRMVVRGRHGWQSTASRDSSSSPR